jgi:hypothetical protein
MGLIDYLQKAIEPHDPSIPPVMAGTRSFAKWWMELVRNLIVVAALQYFAGRSNNLALKVFSIITLVILWGYLSTYLYSWVLTFNPFHPIKNQRLQFILLIVVGAAVGFLIITFANYAFRAVVDAIASAQSH